MFFAILAVSVILAGIALAYIGPKWLMDILCHFYPNLVCSFSTSPNNRFALTIDDAPSGMDTEKIMDVLAAHDAKATFFVIGSYAERYPETVKRMLRDGHEVGHHMWEDKLSAAHSIEEFRVRFDRTEKVLQRILEDVEGKQKKLKYFRPGGGMFSSRMLAFVEERGYKLVLGTVYPHDPQIPFALHSAAYVLARVFSGSIVILHDRPYTIEALGHILLHSGMECCSLQDALSA